MDVLGKKPQGWKMMSGQQCREGADNGEIKLNAILGVPSWTQVHHQDGATRAGHNKGNKQTHNKEMEGGDNKRIRIFEDNRKGEVARRSGARVAGVPC